MSNYKNFLRSSVWRKARQAALWEYGAAFRIFLIDRLKNFQRKLSYKDRLALDWHADLDREMALAVAKDG